MKLQTALIGLAALGCVACGQNSLLAQRQRTGAPTGKSDVGVVVENASPADVEAMLQAHAGAQVRVLNEAHGMYELFGVTKQEARAQTQGAVSDNAFFELHAQNDLARLLSVPAPVGLKVGALNTCKAGPAPTATLSVSERGTLELGKSIKIKGTGGVRQAIVVAAPSASANPQTILDQAQAVVTPDALGLYQVFLVVQDERDVCAMDGVRLIVTANRAYGGPLEAPRVNLKAFSHLAQVDAEGAWTLSEGLGTLIAVIDTGVNYNHPSLAGAIEENTAEILNGVDDDKNGFVDDRIGYDFVNADAFPYDDDGHGTHVAGLAAGRPFGLARQARVLPIKALTSAGGDVGTIAAAIRYAVDRGARIINMSLGATSPTPHPALVSAVAYAESKGALIVASAGNGDAQTGLGFSIDEMPTYPASLANANLLTVASFDAENALSTYSNFGATGVDVVAPGGLAPKDPMISSSFENPKHSLYVGMIGTSMASPVVSGIAAQVWSLAPYLSVAQVKAIMIGAGPEVAALKPVTVSGRHLNARAAVEAAQAKAALF